jgi:hypothetical protein
MKKSIYIISILAAGLLLMVYSCSKEEVQTAKSHENDLTPYEIQVHNAIKGFKSTMEMHRENPHYKSGQVVSPDSALWLLEATINFSHAFPNEFYTEHEIEDLTLVIPKTVDGMIDMAVLTQKYDEMKSDITTVYYGSSFTDKGLVLVDLEEDSQTETELNLRVQVVTGDGGSDSDPGTPGINGPFEEGDDWWYGENVGLCTDPYTILSDAAKKLFAEGLNLVPDPGGNYFFTNLFTFDIQGGDEYFRRPNDPLNNYLDYYLYYSIDGFEPLIPFNEQQMLCLEWPEMNLYYSFLKQLMFTIIPNQYLPEAHNRIGFSISSINYLIDDFDSPTNDVVEYYHKAQFTYGIKVCYAGEGALEL